MDALPAVVVPVQPQVEALDACLVALDRSLPAGTTLVLADDASGDARIAQLLAHWRQRTRLAVRVVREERPLGLPAICNRAFAEAGDADVVLMGADTEATSGWLEQMLRCAASDPAIASISPWSNDAEICSLPRFCEPNPAPEDPELLAEAAARMALAYPDLPAASGGCIYLRRSALRQLGGFDGASFGRGQGAVVDWCLRATAMGWRHVLCDGAYVVRRQLAPADLAVLDADAEDLGRLRARWPAYDETMARFIMRDPLYPQRQALLAAAQGLRASGPQRDLFGVSA